MAHNEEQTTQQEQALLGELESIIEILDEDNLEDIPILNETVEVDAYPPADTATPSTDTTHKTDISLDELDDMLRKPSSSAEYSPQDYPAETTTPPIDDEYNSDTLLSDNEPQDKSPTEDDTLKEPFKEPFEAPFIDDIELDLSEITGVPPSPTPSQQQPLFVESTKKVSPTTTKASATEQQTTKKPTVSRRPPVINRGENPFLPKHIRERLHGEEMAAKFQEPIAPTPQPIANTAPLLTPSANTQPEGAATTSSAKYNRYENSAYEKIINDVVALYLPKIEADIRKQLRTLIEQNASKNP